MKHTVTMYFSVICTALGITGCASSAAPVPELNVQAVAVCDLLDQQDLAALGQAATAQPERADTRYGPRCFYRGAAHGYSAVAAILQDPAGYPGLPREMVIRELPVGAHTAQVLFQEGGVCSIRVSFGNRDTGTAQLQLEVLPDISRRPAGSDTSAQSCDRHKPIFERAIARIKLP